MLNLVLYAPEIPANTGNISRTCAVTNTALHLIKPLGFSLSDKALKRAGLDYWPMLDVRLYECLEDFLSAHVRENLWLIETGGKLRYDEAKYEPGDFIMFGQETKGLPATLLAAHPQKVLRIPMVPRPAARSLNLSNAAALVLYEAYRQLNFSGLD